MHMLTTEPINAPRCYGVTFLLDGRQCAITVDVLDDETHRVAWGAVTRPSLARARALAGLAAWVADGLPGAVLAPWIRRPSVNA